MKRAPMIDLKVGRKLEVPMLAGLQRLYISHVLIKRREGGQEASLLLAFSGSSTLFRLARSPDHKWRDLFLFFLAFLF